MSSNRAIKAVKIFVVLMTALILVGLSLIGYTLLANGKQDGLQIVKLGQSSGTKLSNIVVVDRHMILLHLKGEMEEDKVIVFDLNTGKIVKIIIIGTAL